jgi:hypothetical protein
MNIFKLFEIITLVVRVDFEHRMQFLTWKNNNVNLRLFYYL